jgi:hypothetical protein
LSLRRLSFECCEDRRLLSLTVGVNFVPLTGVLTLTGSAGSDQVRVLARKSYVDVYVSGWPQSRILAANAAKVSEIDFNGGGGDDSLVVQGVAGVGTGPGTPAYTIKLTDVETLSIVKGSNVVVGSNIPLILDTTSLWGTLRFDQTVNGPFSLTQIGPLVVNGVTTFDMGPDVGTSDITLEGPGNNFSTVVVQSAGDVMLKDTNAIVFGESTVSGSLTVGANPGPVRRVAISQTGTLTVDGNTTLTVGPASSILLNHQSGTPLNPDNALSGTVSVTDAANATILNGLPTKLGASRVTGNLSIRATGPIYQYGGDSLDVGKLATIDAFTANASPLPPTYYEVTLNSANNVFRGTLAVPRASNLWINSADALNLGKSTVTGNLFVGAAGDITQSGALVVGGYTDLYANDGGSDRDITLTNLANNFSSGVSGNPGVGVGIDSGRNVSLRDANAVTLRESSVSGDFRVTARGAINQNGSLSVPTGTTFLAAGTANITLPNVLNTFDTLSVTSGNTVQLTNSGPLVLGNWTVAGNLALTADGDVTQLPSSAVVIGRTATFDVEDNDITLENSANDFGTVAVSSAHNVSLQDASAMVLGVFGTTGAPVSGDVSVRANLNPVSRTAIAQSGKLFISGATRLTVGPASSITLTNAGNDFTGPVLLAAGKNVSIRDASAIDFGESTVGGAFNVTAGGDITDNSGKLVITGKTTLSTSGDVAFVHTDPGTGNPDDNFGEIGVTAANDVVLYDVDALQLAASRITGTLDVETGGPITQSGPLSVDSAATFFAGDSDITLTNAGNDFGAAGTASVNLGTGGNVSIRDANAIDFDESSIGGALRVMAGGPITQSGPLSVGGTATFTAPGNDITLLDDWNVFTTLAVTAGNNVAVSNSDALILGQSMLAGTFDVFVAAGGVTQSGPVVVGGTTTLEADGQDIELTDAGNDFATLAVSAGDNVSIVDIDGIVLGHFGLTTPISGDVEITAGGTITQVPSTALVVDSSGTTTLATNAKADITLGETANRFGDWVSVTSGRNVVLAATDNLTLGKTAIGGRLSVVTTGGLTQTADGVAALSVTVDAGTDIDLSTSDANTFGKVSVVQGNYVSLRTAGPLVLTTLTVYGDLRVEAGGAITDTGLVTVVGNTAVISTSDNITLDTIGSTYGSGVGWLSLVGNDVYVKNGGDTLLGECSATNLTVVSVGTATGNITNILDPAFPIAVTGTASFYAGPYDVTLYTEYFTYGAIVTVGNNVYVGP